MTRPTGSGGRHACLVLAGAVRDDAAGAGEHVAEFGLVGEAPQGSWPSACGCSVVAVPPQDTLASPILGSR